MNIPKLPCANKSPDKNAAKIGQKIIAIPNQSILKPTTLGLC